MGWLRTVDVGGIDGLACPVCGFEYVHPISVIVATGIDTTIIDNEGTRIIRAKDGFVFDKSNKLHICVEPTTEESSKADSERGVRIVIEYHCENGHHGNIIFQFHKGNLFVEHEELPPIPPEEWSTLWRT